MPFMKHTGVLDSLGRTEIVIVSQADFDNTWSTRGWVTATQSEADAYFGVPTLDPTYVTTAQLAAALAGVGGGSTLVPTAVKTANYTAAASDFVPVDATSGALTVTLPAAPADKTQVAVKLVSGTNTVTLAAAGSDHFNTAAGSTSISLVLLRESVVLQYKASTSIWYVVAGDTPVTALDARSNGTFQVVLIYASGSYPARPTGVPAGHVRYIGPVQPSDWQSGDEWINNS